MIVILTKLLLLSSHKHLNTNMDKTCIIIPCYNEAKRLHVSEFIQFSIDNPNYYFLFVNDGSTDKTDEVIGEIIKGRKDKVFYLELNSNKGKATAVREGMLSASKQNIFSIIGYLDADLSIPLIEVKRLLSNFNSRNINFVFASRIQIVGSNIKKKLLRHIIGRIFATIASMMLNIKVYDTQCGAKFFKGEIVDLLFKDIFKSKWVFDIEIFFRYKNIFKNVDINSMAKEIPLEHCLHVNGSKIKLIQYVNVPIDMIKIYYEYKK